MHYVVAVMIHHNRIADTESDNIFPRRLTPEVLQALRGVRFIAQHIKDADKDNEVMPIQILKIAARDCVMQNIEGNCETVYQCEEYADC